MGEEEGSEKGGGERRSGREEERRGGAEEGGELIVWVLMWGCLFSRADGGQRSTQQAVY